jgi:hypothetical protein
LRQHLEVAVLAALLAATGGCPGTLEDPERFYDAEPWRVDAGLPGESQPEGGTPTPTPDGDGGCGDVPTSVFRPSCLGMGCHNAQDKAQGLDLESPDLAARLVGVPTTEGAGLLIDPSAPSQSILYEKLKAPPPFGARMPSGSTLDSTSIACVLTWITGQVSASGEPPAEGGLEAGHEE